MRRFEIVAESDARVTLQPIATAGEIRKAQPGDFLSPGQVFGRLTGSGSLVAVIPLEESRLACIRTGMPVALKPKSNPNCSVTASLSQVLPSPITLPGRGERPFYEAIATPERGTADLLPEQTVEAEIFLGEHTGVYTVPRDWSAGGKIVLDTPKGPLASKATPVAMTTDFYLFRNIPELPPDAVLRVRIPTPEGRKW
jgi:hypothetical protein